MNAYTLRPVTEADAPLLRAMAMKSPPLDVHTPYTYWVIARFFGDTSFVLMEGDVPAGYVTALNTENSLFLWQLCILPEHRGKKLSRLLIGGAHQKAEALGKDMCTTIDDKNLASRAAFTAYSRLHGLRMERVGGLELTAQELPDFRETEAIYRIGK